MTDDTSRAELIARRGELIAELFLQDLGPAFVARTTHDMGSDFLVGFTNALGGVNTFAIEVKSTEEPVSDHVAISKQRFDRLAYSNVPAILLVVDVKHNRLHYAWVPSDGSETRKGNRQVAIAVTPVDDAEKVRLRKQFVAPEQVPVGSR
jgi:hypothetical protein